MAATESKISGVKVKPSITDGSSKGKLDPSAAKKKIDSSTKQQIPDSSKHKSGSTVIKTEVTNSASEETRNNSNQQTTLSHYQNEHSKSACSQKVKSKSTPSSSKSTTKSATTKVREKKVYTLAGQKFDPPEEREPLRIFYESLSKQIPTSEMAEFWMMEHGLLSPERAKKAYERKQRKQKQIRMGTPLKSPPPFNKAGSSSQKVNPASKNGDLKAKKRIIDESDDDDLILSKRRKG